MKKENTNTEQKDASKAQRTHSRTLHAAHTIAIQSVRERAGLARAAAASQLGLLLALGKLVARRQPRRELHLIPDLLTHTHRHTQGCERERSN